MEPLPTGGGGSKFSPRNWRVPIRLNAILLIPVMVALVMGGFQVKGSIDTLNEARDAEKTALIIRAAAEYSNALLNERDLTAEPLLKGKRDSTGVRKAYDTTDAAKKKFARAIEDRPDNESLERRLGLIAQAESRLPATRETAYVAGKDPVGTEEAYVDVQHYLMEIANELNLGTGEVTAYGRTLYAIQLSKAAGSLQRSIGTHLIVRPNQDTRIGERQVVAFNSYVYLEGIALQEFRSGAAPADWNLLKSTFAKKAREGQEKLGEYQRKQAAAGVEVKAPPTGKDGSVYTGMASAIGRGQQPDELAARGVTPATWTAVATSKFDAYTEVENNLIDRAVKEAQKVADEATTDAYVTGAIVVTAVLASLLIAGLMAGQMSRSMRHLRSAAFGIAEQRLPALVDQLSRTDPGRVDTRVQPIPITTTDEIGEVARAFDQVHREAVRLAAEQAMLRGNVNAIFTNLSRRNQSLIEGQLTLITDLENNEADPDQLENLFRLDHLATRMRRNGENLLVLAGEEPGRRWDQPVPLVDVLRAAASEVEQYERIELTGVPEAEIHGRAVTDLVHLLAELLENATTFSSPQTKVRVTATRLPDGRVMIEIHDKGIGLTAEDFADINHKLANPPTVDVAISQRMGLFVVGRLSGRHHIRVQLRPSGEQAGTTSLVMLPENITHGGSGQERPQNDFTVSSIIPETEALEAAPLRTAAELGFDDTRYNPIVEAPGDARELDPVGRSRLREERRAALEAQVQQGQPGQFAQDTQVDAPFGQQNAQVDAPFGQQNAQVDAPFGQQNAQVDAPFGQQEFQQTGEHALFHDGSGSQPQGQQPSYEDFAPRQAQQAGAPEQDLNGFAGGFDGYQDHGRSEQPAADAPNGYAEASYQDGSYQNGPGYQQEAYSPFGERPQGDDWPRQDGYADASQPSYQQETESPQAAPAEGRDRVGFDRPGPGPSQVHETTEAGLPRRGGNGVGSSQWQAPGVPQQRNTEPEQEAEPAQGTGDDSWRSANDERWQRANQLRDPKAGGVTPSGLPRRVPKANLVEGTAEQTPQGGPQVSRAPEDVRGRLSNLRRGVQQGRNAGSDSNGQGLGPGSTYNQER